jgi:hypothetical protein
MKIPREDGQRQNALATPESELEGQGRSFAPPAFNLTADPPVQAKAKEENQSEEDALQMKAGPVAPTQTSGAGEVSQMQSEVIQRSALSEELATIWEEQGKGAYFERLRHLGVCDPEVNSWIDNNLHGDDHWLASKIAYYGPEANWPIHLKCEREMKGWGDSGGKGVVFDILRTSNAADAANTTLSETLRSLFAQGSEDLMLALRLQTYGTEANFPAAGDQVNPPSGQQVETWITANEFLNGYISDAIDGGLRVAGAIYVHPPEEFRTLFITYAEGRGMTNADATTMAPNVNAYRDGSEVHMCLDRGEVGTAIHEAIHFFSHDDYRGELGGDANEGTTEYFTRVVTTQQGIVRGAFYTSQRGAVDNLVAATTQEDVGDAYFDGEIDDLRTAVDDAQGEGTFDSWVTEMKAKNWAAANALL